MKDLNHWPAGSWPGAAVQRPGGGAAAAPDAVWAPVQRPRARAAGYGAAEPGAHRPSAGGEGHAGGLGALCWCFWILWNLKCLCQCSKTHYLSQMFAIPFAILIYLVNLTYCKISDRL